MPSWPGIPENCAPQPCNPRDGKPGSVPTPDHTFRRPNEQERRAKRHRKGGTQVGGGGEAHLEASLGAAVWAGGKADLVVGVLHVRPQQRAARQAVKVDLQELGVDARAAGDDAVDAHQLVQVEVPAGGRGGCVGWVGGVGGGGVTPTHCCEERAAARAQEGHSSRGA
jgi:hypothetical protein